MPRFNGKVVVITGAGGGIGAATSRAFAAEGATLMLLDISEGRVMALKDELARAGSNVVARCVDIGNDIEVHAAIDEAATSLGGIDVLCNIAADLSKETIGRDSETDILSVDYAVLQRSINVNLLGYLRAMRYSVPWMIKRGGGSIVNTSSTAAVAPEPRRHAYALSKVGVDVITQQVAATYGKHGIRCNSILPGLVMTYEWPEEWTALHIKLNALPYAAKPEDLASVYVFLASNEARYITGESIRADGGFYARQPGFSEQIELESKKSSQF